MTRTINWLALGLVDSCQSQIHQLLQLKMKTHLLSRPTMTPLPHLRHVPGPRTVFHLKYVAILLFILGSLLILSFVLSFFEQSTATVEVNTCKTCVERDTLEKIIDGRYLKWHCIDMIEQEVHLFYLGLHVRDLRLHSYRMCGSVFRSWLFVTITVAVPQGRMRHFDPPPKKKSCLSSLPPLTANVLKLN